MRAALLIATLLLAACGADGPPRPQGSVSTVAPGEIGVRGGL